MYLPLIALFVAISGSLGVSYMAKSSTPGDMLYPVKIHINENFKQTIVTTTLPLEESSLGLGSSSGSIYLKVSSDNSTPIDENTSINSETMLNASTSLNRNQVINAE